MMLCGGFVLFTAALFLWSNDSLAFFPYHIHHHRSTCGRISSSLYAKGFGPSSSSTRGASPSSKSVLKKVQQRYGGTTPQEIAAGTQRLIEQAISRLPPHLQVAIKLYQQLCPWNVKLENMSMLEQASIPASDLTGAQRAQAELDRIYQEHSLTATDVHNTLQQITWDASADAKVARSITGSMPTDIAARIERACQYVIDATLASRRSSDDIQSACLGRCLDVGCGFGTLVPKLSRTLAHSQIHGIDLSPEMIRNARELYPDCHFTAGDFYEYQLNQQDKDEDIDTDSYFDAVLFCSALHDLPDPVLALKKAASLLRTGGVVVIVHVQGARHVQQQVAANPVLVRRALPDTRELHEMASTMRLQLDVEPAKAGTPLDVSNGYLAVLTKL